MNITLESVSTLTSAVTFSYFSCVLTSAINSSPFLVADDEITWKTARQNLKLILFKHIWYTHYFASISVGLVCLILIYLYNL